MLQQTKRSFDESTVKKTQSLRFFFFFSLRFVVRVEKKTARADGTSSSAQFDWVEDVRPLKRAQIHI